MIAKSPKIKAVGILSAAYCENKSTETGKSIFPIKVKSLESKTADIPSSGYYCHDLHISNYHITITPPE